MLRDIFGQAMEAMRHNGRRTIITIVGMAWGIATVVLLLAYGAGQLAASLPIRHVPAGCEAPKLP